MKTHMNAIQLFCDEIAMWSYLVLWTPETEAIGK